jgi:hypothetical protein
LATERPPGKAVGSFAGADSTAVYVIAGTGRPATAVPRAIVKSIEVSRRRLTATDAFGRGARVGAVVSGTLAAVLVAAAVAYDLNGECGECIPPASVIAVPFGFALTVGGTAVGGVVALGFRDRWVRVWPRRTTPSPARGVL